MHGARVTGHFRPYKLKSGGAGGQFGAFSAFCGPLDFTKRGVFALGRPLGLHFGPADPKKFRPRCSVRALAGPDQAGGRRLHLGLLHVGFVVIAEQVKDSVGQQASDFLDQIMPAAIGLALSGVD
ncbi:MAG: hypothetical protein RJA70_1252 [Pseudomonadota bacterium]